jgi:hypothetical protein
MSGQAPGSTKLNLLVFLFALPAAANAAPDRSKTLSLRPARLFWPALDCRFEAAAGASSAWFVDGAAGRFNPVRLTWDTAFAESQDEADLSFRGTTYELGGGYSYYFNDFGRGWSVGGAAKIQQSNLEMTRYGVDYEVGLTKILIGALGGWKRTWDRGFTLGVQSQLRYGYPVSVRDGTPSSKGTALDGVGQDTGIWVSAVGLDLATYLGWSF